MIEKKCSINTSYGIMNYLVHIPKNLKDGLPILLFLHGIGERGNNIDDIKRYSFPAYISEMNLPYVTICPQCSNNNFWDYHLREIEIILKNVIDEYKCDKNRICIMGSSMGACGAWNYIMERPDLFKCLVSASGRVGLPIDENMNKILDKSFFISHGTDDDIIDCSNSIEIYDKLIKLGAKDVTLKLIEGGNHYVCSTIYKDEEVYKWLSKKL